MFFFRHKESLAYPPHGPKDRFKVVKIVSSSPLRRGRWNVVDYPDKEKTAKEMVQPPQASVVPPSASYNTAATTDPASAANAANNASAKPTTTAQIPNAVATQPPPPTHVGSSAVPSGGQQGGGPPAVVQGTMETDSGTRPYFSDQQTAVNERIPVSVTAPGNMAVRTVTRGAMPAGSTAAEGQPSQPGGNNVVVTAHHTYVGSQVYILNIKIYLNGIPHFHFKSMTDRSLPTIRFA